MERELGSEDEVEAEAHNVTLKSTVLFPTNLFTGL